MSEESPNTRISPQTQPSLHEQIADAVRTVRETTPLAQSFTNFVTINLVANAQLAAGVESVDDVESAIAPAQRLARFMARHGANGTAAVAVSGATDMVTDGEHVYRLAGGSAMMTKITGAGCSLGGVTAVYLAVAQPLIAALAATSLYNTAGEIAEKRSNGPGSFQVALLDALWNVTAEEVADRAIDMR